MSNNSVAIVIQSILDHKDLQVYLHPEVAGRVPLKVRTGGYFDEDIEIQKFGRRVVVTNSPIEGPHIEFKDFTQENKEVHFSFVYEEEGLLVEGDLTLNGEEVSFHRYLVIEN